LAPSRGNSAHFFLVQGLAKIKKIKKIFQKIGYDISKQW
jgi:hypothetical protein